MIELMREATIQGFTVRTNLHRARAAARLLAKLGRVIGPSLARLGDIAAGGDIKSISMEDIVPAIAALFEQLDDKAVDSIILEVLSQSTIVMPDDTGDLRVFDLSRGEVLDVAFTGRVPLMLAVMKFALEVNFGGFFAESGGLAALAAAAKVASSTSPASSGSSGTP